jgi:hypothetical protein
VWEREREALGIPRRGVTEQWGVCSTHTKVNVPTQKGGMCDEGACPANPRGTTKATMKQHGMCTMRVAARQGHYLERPRGSVQSCGNMVGANAKLDVPELEQGMGNTCAFDTNVSRTANARSYLASFPAAGVGATWRNNIRSCHLGRKEKNNKSRYRKGETFWLREIFLGVVANFLLMMWKHHAQQKKIPGAGTGPKFGLVAESGNGGRFVDACLVHAT